MAKHLSASVLVLSFAAWTSALMADESLLIELTAPRGLRVGESLEIRVKTEPLPKGARLLVKTEQGEILGAIAPFGLPGQPSTATIPVPLTALVDGRLRLRFEIAQEGAAAQAPRADQIQLKLFVTPTNEP